MVQLWQPHSAASGWTPSPQVFAAREVHYGSLFFSQLNHLYCKPNTLVLIAIALLQPPMLMRSNFLPRVHVQLQGSGVEGWSSGRCQPGVSNGSLISFRPAEMPEKDGTLPQLFCLMFLLHLEASPTRQMKGDRGKKVTSTGTSVD